MLQYGFDGLRCRHSTGWGRPRSASPAGTATRDERRREANRAALICPQQPLFIFGFSRRMGVVMNVAFFVPILPAFEVRRLRLIAALARTVTP
jgi:hypothetical protein